MGQPAFEEDRMSTVTTPVQPKAPATRPGEPVLSLRDLHVEYYTDAGVVKAVNGISFDLMPGEKLGLVGESGSGKSTMALALMRMIQKPGRISGGQLLLNGVDLVKLSEREMREVRSSQISMIPQGAMNSLNPVMRIEDQIIDTLEDHAKKRMSQKALRDKARSSLESVGLDRAVGRRFPHELSGGMKQRACIAIAVAMEPMVVIADEPTSALDVVVQRQVMDTILRLQQELGVAVILDRSRHGPDGAVGRPARGDLRGQGGRALPDQADLRGAAASLQRAADREPAQARGTRHVPRHPRAAAVAEEPARRLPVPPALPAGDGHLP